MPTADDILRDRARDAAWTVLQDQPEIPGDQPRPTTMSRLIKAQRQSKDPPKTPARPRSSTGRKLTSAERLVRRFLRPE